MEKYSEIFRRRLKELREEKNLSQEALGEKITSKRARNSGKLNSGGKSTISQYENGKREPGLELILQLAQILDVSTSYLIGESDDRRPFQYGKTKEPERDGAL